MNLEEAYAVLGCRRTATYAELRAAYRRLAMQTHPDRGGSAADFLRVHRAFEIVGKSGNRPPDGLSEGETSGAGTGDAELDSLIVEQLRGLDAAYEQLWADIETQLREQFKYFEDDVSHRIASYTSLRAMRKRANRDVSEAWSTFIASIVSYRDSRLCGIAAAVERSLGNILIPAVDRARREHPRRWFEQYSTAILALSVVAGLEALGAVYANSIPLWSRLVAAGTAAACALPPLLYGRKYAAARYMPKVPTSALSNLHVERFATPGGVPPAALGLGAGMAGFYAGSALGGPILGVVVSFLGSLLGRFSLQKKKRELYEKVVSAVISACEELQRQLYEELLRNKRRMATSIRDTFRTSATRLARLLGPGAPAAARVPNNRRWPIAGATVILCVCLGFYGTRRLSKQLRAHGQAAAAAEPEARRDGGLAPSTRAAGPKGKKQTPSVGAQPRADIAAARPAATAIGAAQAPLAPSVAASAHLGGPSSNSQPATAAVGAAMTGIRDGEPEATNAQGVTGIASSATPCATASYAAAGPADPVYANGLLDGFASGAEAADATARGDHHGPPVDERDLDGYSAEMGSRRQYEERFRPGFLAGYRAGYSGQLSPEISDALADAAFQSGLREGYEKGVSDLQAAAPPNARRFPEYKIAADGYSADYGFPGRYRLRFRDGFAVGYAAAYSHVSLPSTAESCGGPGL